MNNAKKETAAEKKARYYMTAEKVLQTSATSYLEAKHNHASQEVQRLLEKAREEQELAASLSEVLHAPTITSSTASFLTLTPSEERAVGNHVANCMFLDFIKLIQSTPMTITTYSKI